MKNMRTTNWNAIVTSAPLNKDAAIARDGRGVGFEPKLKAAPDITHSELPLPTAPVVKGSLDLTGTKFGAAMTVMGKAPAKIGNNAAAWVVRCACGNYEHRTAKAIRNPRNDQDRCRPCRQVEYLKRRERDLRPGARLARTGGSVE